MPKSTTWSIYVIRCKNNALYTGITTDVTRRLQEHQQQSKKCAKYLRGKTPLELVYSQPIGSHKKALQLEQRIKKMTKRQKEAWLKFHINNMI